MTEPAHLFTAQPLGVRLHVGRLAGLFAVLMVLIPAAVASAHGPDLLSSTPAVDAELDASPSEVRLAFSEELVDGVSSVEVVDEMGDRVDDGASGIDLDDPEHATLIAHIAKPLPRGIYTVRYEVLLLDGDLSNGEYRFSVGRPLSAAASSVGAPDTRKLPLDYTWIWSLTALIALVGGAVGALTFVGR